MIPFLTSAKTLHIVTVIDWKIFKFPKCDIACSPRNATVYVLFYASPTPPRCHPNPHPRSALTTTYTFLMQLKNSFYFQTSQTYFTANTAAALDKMEAIFDDEGRLATWVCILITDSKFIGNNISQG